MPKLTIDGQEIEVAPGTSILQAAEQLGIEIPRFCYHDRLSVPANCRMCLVELKGAPKPVASCAFACGDNMEVFTRSDTAVKARRGVMEFLLINHPLDCPICDQGGECDLQDQAVGYGYDRGRYHEAKRAVEEKALGPLIKTEMTRCIQCTRCVRFGDEIAGVSELGMTSRGEESEINTFVGMAVTNELSGNMVDVCPVGALTSRPYAFNARPWELKKTESIDVMDAVGCNTRIDARGGEVLRIQPRLHEGINEEWLNDRSRYCFDALRKRRLDTPWLRENGKLRKAEWGEVLQVVADKLNATAPDKMGAIAGELACAESMKALKDLMAAYGSANIDCREEGVWFDTSVAGGWLFNSTIEGIEQADAILLVGTNPRWEATLVNARIRKHWLNTDVKIGLIGENLDLTYPVEYIGAGAESLQDVLDGKHSFADVLKGAERPMIIMGQGCFTRSDARAVHKLGYDVAEKFGMISEGWNGFNMLHLKASRVAGLAMHFLPGQGGQTAVDMVKAGALDLLWLLGADDIDTDGLKDTFVIYQGSHGDKGATVADVILPGAAWAEKNAIYMNTEGRAQQARMAVFPPGEARPDWKIIRAISELAGKTLPYDTLLQVRDKLAEDSPAFAAIDQIIPAAWGEFGGGSKVLKGGFTSPVTDFYQTNSITRASEILGKCSAELLRPVVIDDKTGTES